MIMFDDIHGRPEPEPPDCDECGNRDDEIESLCTHLEQAERERDKAQVRCASATRMRQVSEDSVENLQLRIEELEKDRERLDWIEAQATGYGIGWIARQSTTGRGFRLHETSGIYTEDGQRCYAREALDAAMNADGSEGGENK